MLSASVRGANFTQLLTKYGQIKIGERCFSSGFGGHMGNRHRDPKWKKHRANQTFRIELPDYEKLRAPNNGKLSYNEVSFIIH